MDTKEIYIAIGLFCALVIVIRSLIIARRGSRIRKELNGMSIEEKEKKLAELKKQKDPAYRLCFEPLNPVVSFIGQFAALIIICIFSAFIIFCIFIVLPGL